MTSTKKDPVLVVLQLAGGNDALNTVVPYSNPKYFDNRPNVLIAEDQVLPIDDQIGFNPNMGPMKKIYDEGHMAVFPRSWLPQTASRSHFSLNGHLAHL
ncbi:MAG: hypothetical protein CM1200mP27_10590 [Chloroflexota bacterium]|nr:MAG: hypothetical protein CM1200mP27_10590 [Chloroflexota bacterium]